MSTAEKYRKRRCFALWAPLAGLGATVYAYSLTFTFTANGLSILGLIILSIGAAAALKESRNES